MTHMPPTLDFDERRFRRILSIDPGFASGWSVWELTERAVAVRVFFGLETGGIEGMVDWLGSPRGLWAISQSDYVIVEKFKTEGRAADLVGAHVEAVIRGELHRRGCDPAILRPNSAKAGVRDQILKDAGMWIEGEQVHWTDGRDVNDSAIHVLSWLRDQDHRPTIRHFWPEL